MTTEVDTEVRNSISKSLKTLTTEVVRNYGSAMVKSLKTLNGSLRKLTPILCIRGQALSLAASGPPCRERVQ
jgi:hypothetical protein